jgi:hypothetical protein
MGPLRRLVAGTVGKVVVIVSCIIAVGIAIYVSTLFFKGDTPVSAFYTTYVCSETGKSFRHKNEMGETLPIYSPYSGKNTGYPGEACFWTADGQIKSEPTWVLLNEAIGKPGPTFCPDCGRLVVGHNPRPKPGAKPPQTQAEYVARHTPSAAISQSVSEGR